MGCGRQSPTGVDRRAALHVALLCVAAVGLWRALCGAHYLGWGVQAVQEHLLARNWNIAMQPMGPYL